MESAVQKLAIINFFVIFPERGLKNLSRVSLEKSWEFVAGGIFSIGLSGLLTLMLIL